MSQCIRLPPSVRLIQQPWDAVQGRRVEAKETVDPLEISPAVSEAAKKSLGRAAKSCRQIGWFSFWTQLSLSIVSAGILLFSVAFTSQVHACCKSD